MFAGFINIFRCRREVSSSMTETRREAGGSPKETKKVHSDCSSSKTDNSSWIPAVAEIQDSDRGAEVVSPRPTTVQQHLLAVADAASSQLARVLPPPEQLPKPLARVYHSLWRVGGSLPTPKGIGFVTCQGCDSAFSWRPQHRVRGRCQISLFNRSFDSLHCLHISLR
jgi:hypothetical protein